MKITHDSYKYIVTKTKDGHIKTIALSSYAGRPVRGTAVCHPDDTYDRELGEKIAAARCAEKIAKKRLKRAQKKQLEAEKELKLIEKYYIKMTNYSSDAFARYLEAERALADISQ